MCRKMRLKAQHRFDASHIEKHIRIDIIQYVYIKYIYNIQYISNSTCLWLWNVNVNVGT